MKTVTISLDDETHGLVEARAASAGASVAEGAVRLPTDRTASPIDADTSKREEARLRAGIDSFTAADRLPRDELYRRR